MAYWELNRRGDQTLDKTLGVVEAIGLASAVYCLLGPLKHLASALLMGSSSEDRSNRVIVELLIMRLESNDVFKNRAPPPAPVLTRLRQLEEIAQKLATRVSSGKAHRMKIALKEGSIVSQIAILRTGLDDIENALKWNHFHQIPQIGGPSQMTHYVQAAQTPSQMSHYTQAAQAPAPGTVQNFIHIGSQPHPVTFNVFEGNGHWVPGHQNSQPSTVAGTAVAYPPGPSVHQPAVAAVFYPTAPLVDQSAVAAAFYPTAPLVDQSAVAGVFYPPTPPTGYPPTSYTPMAQPAFAAVVYNPAPPMSYHPLNCLPP